MHRPWTSGGRQHISNTNFTTTFEQDKRVAVEGFNGRLKMLA